MIFDKAEENLIRFHAEILTNECPCPLNKRKPCKACELNEICDKVEDLLHALRDLQQKRADRNPFDFVEQLKLEE